MTERELIDLAASLPGTYVVIPHPVYATQSWVSILNPAEDAARALLEQAHSRARQ